jgi:hypothetical protein
MAQSTFGKYLIRTTSPELSGLWIPAEQTGARLGTVFRCLSLRLDFLMDNRQKGASERAEISLKLNARVLSSQKMPHRARFVTFVMSWIWQEQYMGAWRSVNDLQVQLGPELFEKFLDFIEKRVAGLTAIETTIVTRAWAARRA